MREGFCFEFLISSFLGREMMNNSPFFLFPSLSSPLEFSFKKKNQGPRSRSSDGTGVVADGQRLSRERSGRRGTGQRLFLLGPQRRHRDRDLRSRGRGLAARPRGGPSVRLRGPGGLAERVEGQWKQQDALFFSFSLSCFSFSSFSLLLSSPVSNVEAALDKDDPAARLRGRGRRAAPPGEGAAGRREGRVPPQGGPRRGGRVFLRGAAPEPRGAFFPPHFAGGGERQSREHGGKNSLPPPPKKKTLPRPPWESPTASTCGGPAASTPASSRAP